MSKSKEVYLRTALSKLATVMVGGTAFLGLLFTPAEQKPDGVIVDRTAISNIPPLALASIPQGGDGIVITCFKDDENSEISVPVPAGQKAVLLRTRIYAFEPKPYVRNYPASIFCPPHNMTLENVMEIAVNEVK